MVVPAGWTRRIAPGSSDTRFSQLELVNAGVRPDTTDCFENPISPRNKSMLRQPEAVSLDQLPLKFHHDFTLPILTYHFLSTVAPSIVPKRAGRHLRPLNGPWNPSIDMPAMS